MEKKTEQPQLVKTLGRHIVSKQVLSVMRQVINKPTKLDNGEIKREQKLPVRFVPMTGEAQQ